MSKMSIWFSDHPKVEAFCFSFLWLALLVFFTYTPLFSALFRNGQKLIGVYTHMQCHTIAMVVNFGLVFMLVVDSWGAKQNQDIWQQILNFVSFFLVIAIYWHSNECVSGDLKNLSIILQCKCLAFLLHIVLLIILLISKTYSVYQTSTIEVDKIKQEI